jgi:hypothetical protein
MRRSHRCRQWPSTETGHHWSSTGTGPFNMRPFPSSARSVKVDHEESFKVMQATSQRYIILVQQYVYPGHTSALWSQRSMITNPIM